MSNRIEVAGVMARKCLFMTAKQDAERKGFQMVKSSAMSLAVCKRCWTQFQSAELMEDDAERDLKRQFGNHQCKKNAKLGPNGK